MGLCINEFVNEEDIIVGYYQDFEFYRKFLQDNYMKIEGLKRQELIIYNCNLDN